MSAPVCVCVRFSRQVLDRLLSVAQDQLAADMYNFFSKEGDYARYFVTVSTLPHRAALGEKNKLSWERSQLQSGSRGGG